MNEAERLEKLVIDLLDFAHTKEPKISEFDLAELLDDIKSMLKKKMIEANKYLHTNE